MMCFAKWFAVLFWLGIGVSEILFIANVNAAPDVVSFTSKPESKTYFRVGQSVSLKWTVDQSFEPVIISFSKRDPFNAYDDLLGYVIPIKSLTVYVDQSRLDMYDQATFRINHTVANDAGFYKCEVTSQRRVIESTTQLVIQDSNKKICNMDIKSIGCFKDSRNNRALSTFLASYRDGNNDEGFILDWGNYQQSIDKILCYCAKKANAGGFRYYGIQYYGECWAGKSSAIYDKYGVSTTCINGQLKKCSSAKDIACTGGVNTIYIYEIVGK